MLEKDREKEKVEIEFLMPGCAGEMRRTSGGQRALRVSQIPHPCRGLASESLDGHQAD